MEQQEATRVTGTLNICYLYDDKDEILCWEFAKHLDLLRRNHRVTCWSPGEILPGVDRHAEIESHISNDQLILLLISSDFLASHLYNDMLTVVFERHQANKARVVPILLRAVDWKDTANPLTHLQALPHNGTPVMSWRHTEEAFTNIIKALRELIESNQELFHRNKSSCSPVLWNIPFRRNPFFTGREVLLSQIQTYLSADKPVKQPYAIYGLAGIGKTQIVLEYAYRYSTEYQAVFWVSVSEAADIIITRQHDLRLFQQAFADVLDWETATYSFDDVLLHT